MDDNWKARLRALDARPGDVALAFSLLSRIPVRVDHAAAGARASQAAWAFPIVGAVLGLIVGITGWVLGAIGLPPSMAAGVALALAVFLTGGLHEDGLADVADGFGGGSTPARRLEIMKDSRVGAFGVLALVLAALLRWSGMDSMFEAGALWSFAAVGAASRVPMTLTMFAMPLARKDGLAAGVGLVAAPTALLGLATGLLLVLLFGGPLGLLALLLALAAAAALCALAWARIEGYTGDVLGAVQQVSEIAALAVFAVAFA